MNYKILDLGALFLGLCCGLATYLERPSSTVYLVGGIIFTISASVKYNKATGKDENEHQNSATESGSAE
ncbi:hypothetical protein ACUZ8Y_22325 [Aeromonas veronii]|uniref:hypothetical protein n=1 Tax=Aeromonas veronii TaxID=654 RepID=UPI00406B9F27